MSARIIFPIIMFKNSRTFSTFSKYFLKIRIKLKLFHIALFFLTINSYQLFLSYKNFSFSVFAIESFNIFTISYLLFLPAFLLPNNIFCNFIAKFYIAFHIIISPFIVYFINKIGIAVDRITIQTILHTDITEVWELMNIQMLAVILFYIIFVLLISNKTYLDKSKKGLCIPFVIVNIILFKYFYLTYYRPIIIDDMAKFVPINYHFGLFDYYKKSRSAKNKMQHDISKINISKVRDNTTVIFLLGESARRSNFSIYNYHKNTSPNLQNFAKEKNFVKFPNHISDCVATADCLKKIFISQKNPEKISVLAKMTKAGIDVKWISNQNHCAGVCLDNQSTFVRSDSKYRDFCSGIKCYDEILIEYLKDILNNKKDNKASFILLHTQGSHYNYIDRIDKKFLKNILSDKEKICKNIFDSNSCSKDEIINIYDNTILYTDYIIGKIINYIKTMKNQNIVFIYLSDHGEMLGEDNLFMHGMKNKYVFEVPAIFWISESYRRNVNPNITNYLKNIAKSESSHYMIEDILLKIFKLV
jgi:lipid A ethanolaminephosphotransferase